MANLCFYIINYYFLRELLINKLIYFYKLFNGGNVLSIYYIV